MPHQQQNVKLTAAPVECSCGRWFADEAGVNACQQHNHYSRKVNVNAKYQATASMETDITVYCAECGEQLHCAARFISAGNLVIDLPPHRCQINAPEVVE